MVTVARATATTQSSAAPQPRPTAGIRAAPVCRSHYTLSEVRCQTRAIGREADGGVCMRVRVCARAEGRSGRWERSSYRFIESLRQSDLA
eukprot:1356949-Prymnesium_polylepis.2